jgi:TetR/AcrR family transcriptional repressor of nem operon
MGRTSDARERLIETTLDLVRRDGYGAVSVDAICEAVGVKKGSFYHFFPSKDALVIAALDWHWEWVKERLDRIFAPELAPLARFGRYFDFIEERQAVLKKELGCVVGCALYSLGTEVSARSPKIRSKIRQLVGRYLKYFEAALHDLHDEGRIASGDFAAKARALFNYHEGVLAQARINDDLSIVRDVSRGLHLIGLKEPAKRPRARLSA